MSMEPRAEGRGQVRDGIYCSAHLPEATLAQAGLVAKATRSHRQVPEGHGARTSQRVPGSPDFRSERGSARWKQPNCPGSSRFPTWFTRQAWP